MKVRRCVSRFGLAAASLALASGLTLAQDARRQLGPGDAELVRAEHGRLLDPGGRVFPGGLGHVLELRRLELRPLSDRGRVRVVRRSRQPPVRSPHRRRRDRGLRQRSRLRNFELARNPRRQHRRDQRQLRQRRQHLRLAGLDVRHQPEHQRHRRQPQQCLLHPGQPVRGTPDSTSCAVRWSTTTSRSARLHWTATFGDVPTSHPQFQFIEALVASGVTAGCGGGNYCPGNPLTRGQMAVFLSKLVGLSWPN